MSETAQCVHVSVANWILRLITILTTELYKDVSRL